MELIPIGYPSAVTLFIIFGIILMTFIKYNFGKNMKESFMSFFNYRQSIRVFEERREYDRRSAILSNILFSLVVGIFISLLFPFFGAIRYGETTRYLFYFFLDQWDCYTYSKHVYGKY